MSMTEDIRAMAATAAAAKYKVYRKTIAGNTPYTTANNLINVGADLKALYGNNIDVPASAGFIYATGDIQIKFNSIDNDEFQFDISEFGKVYTINRGDLLIYKIYFGNNIPTGTATDVTIQVLLSGSPLS